MKMMILAFALVVFAGCAEPRKPIGPGDVVTLRSSHGRMTVEKIEGEKVYCVWEVETNSGFGYSREYRRDSFDKDMLDVMSQRPGP